MSCHQSPFLGSKLRILVLCCCLFAFVFDVFCFPYKPNKPNIMQLIKCIWCPNTNSKEEVFVHWSFLIVDNAHCTISVLRYEGNCPFQCRKVLVFLYAALGIMTSVTGSPSQGSEPIGVFWDIENCPVPRGKSASAVVQKIRKEFFTGKREVEFMCVCDISKEKKEVIEELNKAQVSLT